MSTHPHAVPSGSSVWMDALPAETAPLRGDTECDVCVVGGGIAGVLVAERLTREGKQVVLLDQGRLGSGETGRTTAHFSNALDDRYTSIERMHGEEGARIAAESHTAAIGYVETLVRRLGVDCRWVRLDGYLVVNERHAARRDELLGEELDVATRLGVQAQRVEMLPSPWPAAFGAAIRFSMQAQAHPVRLIGAAAAKMIDAGARVFTGTHAEEIDGGAKPEVRVRGGGRVRCEAIVVATNTPVHNRVAMHTKQAGYQTYVIGVRVPEGSLPPILLWDGVWEDDEWYHYVRLAEHSDGSTLVIVGGEDHKTGQGPDGDGPYQRLEAWTRQRLGVHGEVVRRWSGEVMEPADGMGYIGEDAAHHRNVYVVTGDSGNGMTHGAIAAMLIPDLILGRGHPWAKLYDPARKVGAHALGTYTKENLNTVAAYRDWVRRGDVKDESEIAAGAGAILVKGLKRIAVYKDEHGACTRLNATCPHLGGVVRWNELERTWDCPCHASRFDRYGKMVHGPANSDLKPEP